MRSTDRALCVRLMAAWRLQEAAINKAIGEAETILRRSKATADGVRLIASSIASAGGTDAVSMTIAQQYVEAFGKIAQSGTTMIVPADASNVAGMVAQASAVFKKTAAGSTTGDAGAAPVPGNAGGEATMTDEAGSDVGGACEKRPRPWPGASPAAAADDEATPAWNPALRQEAEQRPVFSLQPS